MKEGEANTDVLTPAAKTFRAVHTGIAAVDLAALAYIWTCVITRRRGRLLTAAVLALIVEGAALIVGRGDCPLGPLQSKLGDSVPLFELVLSPRAARSLFRSWLPYPSAVLALVALRRPTDDAER